MPASGSHDSSYTDTRYFLLDHQAKTKNKWEILPREIQIFHCLALALITLNMDEMKRQSINFSLSMSLLPESEMTEEEKVIKERLTLTSKGVNSNAQKRTDF